LPEFFASKGQQKKPEEYVTQLPNPEFWSIAKAAVESGGGLVASQHYAASAVGAKVLADGGNAMDAAVATGLAIGCVEPWMSGIGGGGFMLYAPAGDDRVHTVEFGMVAPANLDPADYPLVEGSSGDLFGWPGVLDDRNTHGFHSIAVPGYVAGISAALEKFGTRSWQDSIAPAVELAEAGMNVDWYASMLINGGADLLRRYEEARRIFLPNDLPPVPDWTGQPAKIRLGNLAATLKRLRDNGPREFYEGETAQAIARDAQAGGSKLSVEDLAAYRPRMHDAQVARYRDAEVIVAPGLTAGPTLHHFLDLMSAHELSGSRPDADAYAAYARALLEAYRVRLDTLGDADETRSPSCTTHLTVIDRDGNMVTLTQTLLSLFGSRVMLPETGILMNNGIMWFDTRPHRPNSIRPGRRPLSNMCPTVVRRGDGFRFAVGASGGRRIMPAVAQLISFMVDFGMDMDAAFHTPRIDVSGTDTVTVDAKIAEADFAKLAAEFKARQVSHGVYPPLFACPNAVGAVPGGSHVGAAYLMSPWARVMAEG
jgi:gamma-glutamyltranspeptidase/glutathione hydrolase